MSCIVIGDCQSTGLNNSYYPHLGLHMASSLPEVEFELAQGDLKAAKVSRVRRFLDLINSCSLETQGAFYERLDDSDLFKALRGEMGIDKPKNL